MSPSNILAASAHVAPKASTVPIATATTVPPVTVPAVTVHPIIVPLVNVAPVDPVSLVNPVAAVTSTIPAAPAAHTAPADHTVPAAPAAPSVTPVNPAAPVTPAAAVGRAVPTTATKRFRFTAETELLLLKAVSLARAHVAPWGSGGAAYDEALKIFLSACENRIFVTVKKPSAKTLKDKFHQVLAERRAADRANRDTSGVDAPYGEHEALLDDIIQECDEQESQVKAGREQRASKEQALIAAGEAVREKALKRSTGGGTQANSIQSSLQNGQNGAVPAAITLSNTEMLVLSSSAAAPASTSGSTPPREAADAAAPTQTPTPSKSRRGRSEFSCESDEERAMIHGDLLARRESDTKRLKMEASRLELAMKKEEREATRQARRDDLDTRRLELDERRAVEELEERRESLKERRSMVDVLGKLAEKLG